MMTGFQVAEKDWKASIRIYAGKPKVLSVSRDQLNHIARCRG